MKWTPPLYKNSQALTGYRVRYERLPAFDLTGFTKIVESGGEMYAEGAGRRQVGGAQDNRAG